MEVRRICEDSENAASQLFPKSVLDLNSVLSDLDTADSILELPPDIFEWDGFNIPVEFEFSFFTETLEIGLVAFSSLLHKNNEYAPPETFRRIQIKTIREKNE